MGRTRFLEFCVDRARVERSAISVLRTKMTISSVLPGEATDPVQPVADTRPLMKTPTRCYRRSTPQAYPEGDPRCACAHRISNAWPGSPALPSCSIGAESLRPRAIFSVGVWTNIKKRIRFFRRYRLCWSFASWRSGRMPAERAGVSVVGP